MFLYVRGTHAIREISEVLGESAVSPYACKSSRYPRALGSRWGWMGGWVWNGRSEIGSGRAITCVARSLTRPEISRGPSHSTFEVSMYDAVSKSAIRASTHARMYLQ